MGFKLVSFVVLSVFVLKSDGFYGSPYQMQPAPYPYGFSGGYGGYMNGPYQGYQYPVDFIDLPSSAEMEDKELEVSEEVNSKLAGRNFWEVCKEDKDKGWSFSGPSGNSTVPSVGNSTVSSNSTGNSSVSSSPDAKNKTEGPVRSSAPQPVVSAPLGTPFGGTPYWGSPYGGAPYWGSPYGGAPYWGSPFGGSPYGGAPYGGSPYGGAPYGGALYQGPAPVPAVPSQTAQAARPLLDPNLPPYPYRPQPGFKVIKQETGDSIKDVVRGPVQTSTLTVAEPSKTVITRTIDPKTGEAVVAVTTPRKSEGIEAPKSTTKRSRTFTPKSS